MADFRLAADISNQTRLATACLVVVSAHHNAKRKFRQIFPKISPNFRYFAPVAAVRCNYRKRLCLRWNKKIRRRRQNRHCRLSQRCVVDSAKFKRTNGSLTIWFERRYSACRSKCSIKTGAQASRLSLRSKNASEEIDFPQTL